MSSKLYDCEGVFLDFVNIEETEENIQILQELTDRFSENQRPICLDIENHSLMTELLEGTHELTVGHCIS